MLRKYTPTERIDKFWSRVDKSAGPDACWLWMGARISSGYGRTLWWNGKHESTHRIAWSLMHGFIPDGLCVLHRCDNPPCVNPLHLWLGTLCDNSQDSRSKGRMIVPGLKGESHGQSKLTEAQVVEIRERYAAGGITQDALAQEYGVNQTLIGFIVRRVNWTHI